MPISTHFASLIYCKPFKDIFEYDHHSVTIGHNYCLVNKQ